MTPFLVPLLVASSPWLHTVAAPHDGDDLIHPDFAELAQRWDDAARDFGVPGAAVVVVELGEVLHLQTHGLRDVRDERPVTPDTMFYIASATKPFVAFATLMLAEEGKLELDAPVRTYLPRFALADEDMAASITVRDLLCHRPGLNCSPIVYLDAYTGQIDEDRYYHFLKDVVPLGHVEYTNVHFTLAGRVLQGVTGMHWKEVLRERIFTPLGMQNTTGYATWMYAQEDVAYPSRRTAHGFDYASVRKIDETMHAAGGLGLSARDAARWLSVHLEQGELDGARLLSPESIEELTREQSRVPGRSDRAFGLGWMRRDMFGFELLQHGGGYVGSAALLSFMPEIGVGVAVLANAETGHALCELVTGDVYAHMLAVQRSDPLRGLRERAQRGGSDEVLPEGENPVRAADGLALAPEAYVGEYDHEHWGTITIELDERGEMRGHLGNVRFALLSRGTDRALLYSSGAMENQGVFVVEDGRVLGIDVELTDEGVAFR